MLLYLARRFTRRVFFPQNLLRDYLLYLFGILYFLFSTVLRTPLEGVPAVRRPQADKRTFGGHLAVSIRYSFYLPRLPDLDSDCGAEI
jgi:hypothetical protein